MIGLLRGTVKLENHSVEWEKNAADTIKILKEIFKDKAVDIQHVGSTSVTGLKAKPIIDIVVGVKSFEEIYDFIPELEKNGIVFRQQSDDHLFFVCGDMDKEIRTHHIHVAIYKGKKWDEYIKFRDTLNNNTEIRKEYEDLKVKLASDHADDRESYTAMKAEFIQKNCNL